MTNIAQIDYNDKSIDGVLRTRTGGGGMIGAEESTELWRHPQLGKFVKLVKFCVNWDSII